MISISTISANQNGSVVLMRHHGSKLKEKPFRVSRTQTLDGGVFINHSGYTDGDRTLSVSAQITEAQESIITSISQSYTSFLVSMSDGLYLGSISRVTAENGSLAMTIYLKQKEN